MPRPKHRPNRRNTFSPYPPFPYQCPSCLTHPAILCAGVVMVTLLFLFVLATFLLFMSKKPAAAATFNGFPLPEGVTVEMAAQMQRDAGLGEMTNLERYTELTIHTIVLGSIASLGKEYGYAFNNPDLDKAYEKVSRRPPPSYAFDPKRFVSARINENESIEEAQGRLRERFSAMDPAPTESFITSALRELAEKKSGAWYAAEKNSIDRLRGQLKEHAMDDGDGLIFVCTLRIPVDGRANISTNVLMPTIVSNMRRVYGRTLGPFVVEWTMNWQWEQMGTLYLRFRTKEEMDKNTSIYYAAVHPDNVVSHAEKFVEIAHRRATARKNRKPGDLDVSSSSDEDD